MIEPLLIEVPVISTITLTNYFYAVTGSYLLSVLYSLVVYISIAFTAVMLFSKIYSYFKGGNSADALLS